MVTMVGCLGLTTRMDTTIDTIWELLSQCFISYEATVERNSEVTRRFMIMSKVVMRTEDIDSFFERAKATARSADEGKNLSGTFTLSFEDPKEMLALLTESRRQIMKEILHESVSISVLTSRLHRKREAITKDVGILEKMGLIVSDKKINPSHGVQKFVRSVAPRIELVSTLA